MNKMFSGQNIFEKWYQISNSEIENWMSPVNLKNKNKRVFEGFEVTDSIDDGVWEDTEISLIRIKATGQYPQHVHDDSDAYFIIISGEAVFLSGDNRRKIRSGDRIDIPKGTPHGFELKEGGNLVFVSIQSPPIRDKNTGDEDFRLFDLT